MNTVCPFYQCPPATPTAQSRSLPSLAASVHLPHSRQSPFSVRLRSSQIVSDRLGSSQIVWDRPSASPPTVRHSRRTAEMFARFRPPNRQISASKRIISRQTTHANARERKNVFPRHSGVVFISNDWSTRVGNYSMPAFSSDSGSRDYWRQDRRASRSRQPCRTQESDELEFRQMSKSPKHHPPSTIHCSYTFDSRPKRGLPPYLPSVDQT